MSPAREPLAVSHIGAPAAARQLLMLHGIYGRGRNWLGIARAVVAARPEYGCWLIDLPRHGDSGPSRHGDTVHGAAAELDAWLNAGDVTPHAVLGHSYGGKVALSLAALRRDQPLDLWIIDSTPETREPSGSAWSMLQLVRRLPRRFATREEAIAAIAAGGFPAEVAQWMATNLTRDGDAFEWRLDFEAMQRLLEDFFRTDLWHVVERPAPRHRIHVLKASESDAISPEAAGRIAAASGDRVHLHHADGGHWIHAGKPELVTGLLLEHLP